MSLCVHIPLNSMNYKSLPKSANKTMSKQDAKETPLRICRRSKRGSFTLEAACVIPFTAAFLAFILCFFRVLAVETEVYAALNYAGRRAAAMGHTSGKELAGLSVAEGLFLTKLRESETASTCLNGVDALLAISGSSQNEEYYTLSADYSIPLPIPFFLIHEVPVHQEIKCRKWIGSNSAGEEKAYVYVTETGTVYHVTKKCTYLDLSIREIKPAEIEDLRNKNGHKYYECERCVAKNTDSKHWYVTDYGDCFHNSLQCSGLKRTITVLLREEVTDKRPCSKCAKE